MPTLVVENVPTEVYESLQKRAAAGRQSIPEVMLELLGRLAREEMNRLPRLPDLIDSEEANAYCDLPRSSQPVKIKAHLGQLRLPDPLAEETAE
jgi:predicted CopG family antitoxin